MAAPRIVILYNEPTLPADHPDADSEHDVLDTADTVAKHLLTAGLHVERLGVGTNPQRLIDGLNAARPDAVFNLYEGTAGWPNSETYVAGILELLKLPYTGCPVRPIELCKSKPLTKYLLAGAGLPTAPFIVVEDGPCPANPIGWPVIVKPGGEDASVGIDQASVCTNQDQLAERVAYIRATYGPGVLVERLIVGREFNVPVIERNGAIQVLPFSEILFPPPPDGAPLWPIMTFDAKWRPQSRDFHATPVKNPAEDVDPRLHAEVVRITRQCFELLGCRDYARVDYRIDEAGRPYVLEVNPNPCISPLAGVAAALESAKIPYAEFLTGLVRAALRRGPRPELADWTNATATPVASGPVTNWTVTEVAAIDADALRSLVRLDAMFLPDDRTRNEAWLLSQWERSTLQFAVTDGGRVRGAASVTLIDSNLGVYQWTGLAVHPEDRRCGIGQTLMTHVHRAIRALGGRMLLGHVATHPGFAAVRQLLSARGYRPSGEIAEYFPDGYSRQTFAMAFPQIHQTNSNPIHDQSVTSFPTRYSVSGSNLM